MALREERKPKRGAVLVGDGLIEITADSYTKITRKVRDSDYDEFPGLGEKPGEVPEADDQMALESDVTKLKVPQLVQCLVYLGVPVTKGLKRADLVDMLLAAREERSSDTEGDAESDSI